VVVLTASLKFDAWLTELIRDSDVKETMDKGSPSIVASVMDLVAPTSSNGQGKGKEDRKILDIGVLRFPDITRPFLRVRDLNSN
jgi:hypothetical protein